MFSVEALYDISKRVELGGRFGLRKGETRASRAEGQWYQSDANLKLGAGYNFSDFKDDLTELDYEQSGWFVNLIGKY